MRVGIEAFFCVVRNTPEYVMDPVWFFTSEALLDYMPTAVHIHKPFDIVYVGSKIEAFAVAGCDVVSKWWSYYFSQMPSQMLSDLLCTSKQKADYIKQQIGQKISKMLSRVLFSSSFKFRD